MSKETSARWAKREEFCETCHVWYQRAYRDRHAETKMHVRLSGERDLPSDIAFTAFLSSIDPTKFRGVERAIYERKAV